jgi:hypothetical protein
VGREIICRVRHEGRTAQVKALLETDAVILRGEIKANLPFSSLTRIEAKDGELRLNDTVLELGDASTKWREKILHPPTLLDKLGIKPGSRSALIDFEDRSFMGELPYDEGMCEGVEYDAVLFHASTLADLGRLPQIGKNTMLWIIYPKGRKDITEAQVFAAGKAAGLVDIKTCRFSDTLTGLKFVWSK